MLLDDLRSQIRGGNIIAIVGAGVSIAATRNAPVASWTGLLMSGVERCSDVVPNLPEGWEERVRSEIGSGDIDDMLSAAEKISSKLGAPNGGEYGRWLRDTVGALRVQDAEVIETLLSLNVPIATTNYDGLIEEVSKQQPITWRQGSEVEMVLRNQEQGILHLHGFWKDPASVVLGIRSYDAVLGDTHAQTVLRALRMTHTFLFIGFGAGLSDPNFRAFLNWTRRIFVDSQFRHFRLVLESEVSSVQSQHPQEERIFALPYGNKHSDIIPFLRNLSRKTQLKRDAKAEPKSVDKPEDLQSTRKEGQQSGIIKDKISIFYSYAHEDEDLRDQLETHLSLLRRMNIITSWYDRKITAGHDWEGSIDDKLNTAQIILLLLSSDFLASGYIYDVEVERALQRHVNGEARVIPIILRPVDWLATPLSKFQALPRDGRPVTKWADRDEAFIDIAVGIRRVCEELREELSKEEDKVPVSSPKDLQIYRMIDVFKDFGQPTVTFVETDKFIKLKNALAEPGRGLVIEGPSGAGKSTALIKAIEQLKDEGVFTPDSRIETLSTRKQEDMLKIRTLQQWHEHVVAIDDFHRLDPQLYQEISDYMKYLADAESFLKRLVIVGIPRSGQSLINVSFDLATRITFIGFSRVEDDAILSLIDKGEQGLNISFDRKTEIARAAGGSLNIAQLLCRQICMQAKVHETQEQPLKIRTDVDSATGSVLGILKPKFHETARRFAALGGPNDQTCLRILQELAVSEDGFVSLNALKDKEPKIASGIQRFIDEKWIEHLYAFLPDSQKLLFFDPTISAIIIDDPQLGFYLNRTSLVRLAREAGKVLSVRGKKLVIVYVQRDIDWLNRLSVHLAPLRFSREIELDFWEEKRLKQGSKAVTELKDALESATIILLLVSADFLASEFVMSNALLPPLVSASERGVLVSTVILRPCNIYGTELANFAFANSPDNPLIEMSESAQDKIWSDLTRMIEAKLN